MGTPGSYRQGAGPGRARQGQSQAQRVNSQVCRQVERQGKAKEEQAEGPGACEVGGTHAGGWQTGAGKHTLVEAGCIVGAGCIPCHTTVNGILLAASEPDRRPTQCATTCEQKLTHYDARCIHCHAARRNIQWRQPWQRRKQHQAHCRHCPAPPAPPLWRERQHKEQHGGGSGGQQDWPLPGGRCGDAAAETRTAASSVVRAGRNPICQKRQPSLDVQHEAADGRESKGDGIAWGCSHGDRKLNTQLAFLLGAGWDCPMGDLPLVCHATRQLRTSCSAAANA